VLGATPRRQFIDRRMALRRRRARLRIVLESGSGSDRVRRAPYRVEPLQNGVTILALSFSGACSGTCLKSLLVML